MAKIERVELYHVSIPLPDVFFPSWIPGYPQRENRFTLIRIYTSDGIEGVSAGPSFTREREGLGHVLGPYLVGMSTDDLDGLRQRLRELSYLGWRNPWIEPALWDIMGKEKGFPVYRLINPDATTTEAKVYASTGEVQHPEKRFKYMEDMISRGIDTVKLRVHKPSLQEDIENIRPVLERYSDKVTFGVDANQGWPVSILEKTIPWTLDRAKEFCNFLGDYNVDWIEEPLDMNEYDQLSSLRKESPVKIAGGELNAGWKELKIMIEKECLDIYQPDATLSGGITDSVKTMKECREKGFEFTPHTWTNGIGFLINLHVYAAGDMSRPIEYPYEPPGWVPEARDAILDEPIIFNSNGTIPVPQTGGLGVFLNKKNLRKYSKLFYKGTKFRVGIQVAMDRGIKNAVELLKIKKELETTENQ